MKINNFEQREFYIELYEKYQNLLTQTQKQAFRLYFYENLSYQEIANITATTRSAAYDSVKKALKKLLNINENIQ
ncbi:hypothetical protein EG856_03020 [Mycoplasmopsis phocirhinis]|uniref:Sigma-70 family RNA polymerase sigma factor n=1 Tax=Mycoplasmopsis phocirhinis TaxID=142650 RepID=A0A4P6MS16_9BACT|nr:sigma factor-like helix-turn-helix DNA-binding protein [Mycoplasmopsis phocirhinis]QBF34869.1 hypothetical protein EG856_03020 [Mycoplasmopsis phocirhinis]